MKTRIFIFSALISMCGLTPVHSSECIGDDCDIKPLMSQEFEWTQNAAPQQVQEIIEIEECTECAQEPRMVNAKLLTIKPVAPDNRPPLWDGSHNNKTIRAADKTVDWRDGVPIWDDSISSYRYKDFSDWFIEPMPEIYLRDTDAKHPVDLYQQNMADAEQTRARIEELLTPKKPDINLWFTNVENVQPRAEYVAQDMTTVVREVFGTTDDGCPFETETECNIWRRKPIVRETVSPRSPKLRDINMSEFIQAAACNKEITANETVSAPLLARYRMLMNSAQACCTDGMVYSLRQAGANEALIYKFMADDANFYGFGARCLMMTDYDLDTKYPNTATAVVAADVRNGCLCRGRQWFEAMLAPFKQAYEAMPEFADMPFHYTYTDGLKREITVSVNNDIQNVLKQLAQCP